jgi:uncharacterized protein YrrD
MIKAQSVIGKPVLSRADGEKLDSVKDVIIGTDHTRVIALLITEGGLFSKPTVVPIESVVSFGKDAVMITDSKAAQRADHVPAVAQALDMDEKLGGKKVFSETGDQHGKLSDIYFDEKTGDLTGVDVTDLGPGSQSKEVAFLDMSDIISFGADAVVITSSAVSKLSASATSSDHASVEQAKDSGPSAAGGPLEPQAGGSASAANEASAVAHVDADSADSPPATSADTSARVANGGATSTTFNPAKPGGDGDGGSGTAASD